MCIRLFIGLLFIFFEKVLDGFFKYRISILSLKNQQKRQRPTWDIGDHAKLRVKWQY